MSCPYISVVTVRRERAPSIAETARALRLQTLAFERFEWVVCLDEGDAGARAELEGLDPPFGLRLVDTGPVATPGAARNACASRTCGSILLFPQAAWLPAPGSLAAHVALQEAGLCVAEERARRTLRRLGGRAARTGAWSAPGRVFRAVGGFDEGAGAVGAIERRLRRRLRRAGLDARAVPAHGRAGGDSVSDYATMEDPT